MKPAALYFNDIVTSLPWLIVSLGAVLLMVLEVTPVAKRTKGELCSVIGVLALGAQFLVFSRLSSGATLFSGAIYADLLTGLINFLLLSGTVIASLFSLRNLGKQGVETEGEYYTLMLMATSGAMIFSSAAELIALFVGLEIMSMALYALCGSALGRAKSSEAALKYFLLGSFSSAFLLYGIALLYGLTGSTHIPEIAAAVGRNSGLVVNLSLGLMLVGFIFKIGGAPFHFWAPDVYQGAPTPVTAFMATVVKLAAFAAFVRILWGVFGGITAAWAGAIWISSVLTMTIGNLSALRQTSVKRLLAFSSVAHAGYLMVGLLVPAGMYGGGAAIVYYLLAYCLMTLGAFGVVMLVAADQPEGADDDDIEMFRGLGYRRPLLALGMSLFLFSLAGLPPGFAGLVGKFYLFNAAVQADYVGLAIIGVLNSTVSCFYYLRFIVLMYFSEESAHGEASHAPDVRSGAVAALSQIDTSAVVLALLAVATLFIGLMPGIFWSIGQAVTASI
jgi:NADH-quinone oxidoreductase subunit N